jgi:hypothetical protein
VSDDRYTDLLGSARSFLARYYATATPDRRLDVHRQLDALLGPGTPDPRDPARLITATAGELATACGEVMAGPALRDPDRAVVVLLAKLGDRSRRIERSAAADAATAAGETRSTAADVAAAERWLSDSPATAAVLDRDLDLEFPASEGNPVLTLARGIARTSMLLTRWRQTTATSGPTTRPSGHSGPEPASIATALTATAASDVTAWAAVIAAWATHAVSTRWGTGARVYAVDDQAMHVARALLAAGVTREYAQASMHAQCRESDKAEPPKTLRGFLPGILRSAPAP